MLCSMLAAQRVSDSNCQEIQVLFSIERLNPFYHCSFQFDSLHVGKILHKNGLEKNVQKKVDLQADD